MAIDLNDNLKINVGKPVDSKYLNGLVPYIDTIEANTVVPLGERYVGLTVNVAGIEYWYATGLTNSDLIIKTAGAGSNASGERIEKTFLQTGHSFVIGDVITWSGNTFIKAIADGSQNTEVIGIVTDVIDVNNFTVVFSGYIENISSLGLLANTTYYLSTTIAGGLDTSDPIIIGTISKPILTTLTTNDALVFQYRGIIVSSGSSGGGSVSGITGIENIGGGEGEIFSEIVSTISGDTARFRTITSNTGATITTTGDSIIIDVTGTTTVIGPARDGTYDDGLFPFTPDTPTGFAIDDINEFLGALAPNQPPELSDHATSGTFVNGNLSWGASKNDISYVEITPIAGNTAVDINELYQSSGTRKGITQLGVSGILNDNVVGDISGIPFLPNSFRDGEKESLVFELNGSVIDLLDLTSTTGSTSSTFMSVSAAIPVKFDNGNDFPAFLYRTGTYTLSTINFVNGFNYLRIYHSGSTFTRVTNYNEWVYDPENTPINISGESLINLNTTGSLYVSGVEYNTGGSVDYNANISNAYKNVYSNSANAISFPSRVNLSTQSVISVTGSGITSGNTTSLPLLLTNVTNPQDTSIDILATLPISNNIVIGSLGTSGSIESNIRILHPITNKIFIGGTSSLSGFLVYNVVQPSNDENENFTGEINRVEARDYTTLSYANINSGIYAWDSTESLIGVNAQHNTGLLVINGELMYPNASYLNSTYGITNGDFSSVTNAPIGNPNYSTATGIRDYYRVFKSNNTITQSTITLDIAHTGSQNDFLTDGGTSGVTTGNDVKVEFLIKRSNGSTHGWANPFAQTGNPEGIANTSINTSGGVTTVTATLSTVPRIGNQDIVIVRIFTASGYTNRISNLSITNI